MGATIWVQHKAPKHQSLTQTLDCNQKSEIIENILWPVAAVLCTGGADVIRKEAWPFYRTISRVRLCWELAQAERPEDKLP